MEQRRINWPAWLALGISLVALAVALGSMAMSRRAMWTAWAMPGWSNQQAVPNTPSGWKERGNTTNSRLPAYRGAVSVANLCLPAGVIGVNAAR